MSAPTLRQLSLLADHLKLSLLERQRAISLNLDPNKQNGNISRSLTQLQEGIANLSAQQTNLNGAAKESSDLTQLRGEYANLYAQFHGEAPPTADIQQPNDPTLKDDFSAAKSPQPRARGERSVRFRDDPDEEDADRRIALFAGQERYQDEADASDQTDMDNQQIHQFHTQVLRDQDEQLDTLGHSIRRQRMLGIHMGNELDEQNELLDDVESGVDRHTHTLNRAQRRLTVFSRKARENWNWIIIAILIVILVLLIVILK